MTQLSMGTIVRRDLDDLLYRYQKVGANYLFQHDRALLADQMGLGKTVQAIAAMRSTDATIVVCPASLTLNWLRELGRFRPELPATVKSSFVDFPPAGSVSIISYNRLPDANMICPGCEGRKTQPCSGCDGHGCESCDLSGRLGCSRCSATGKARVPRWTGPSPICPVTLVLDEGHYCKTSHSKRTQAVRALASVCKRVWVLTGTPLLNRPPELWALLQTCKWSGREVFGSWENMVRLFDGHKMRHGGYRWGPNVSAQARERLSKFMLRRTRAEVMSELPGKTYRDLVVPLAKKDLTGHDFSFLSDWSDDRVLRECEPDGSLFSVRRELAEAKHEALFQLLDSYEQEAEPVVVFSMHRAIVSAHANRKGWAVVTGESDPVDRERAVRLFQDGALLGIAGTIGAMGVGLTLTAAAHAVFVDRSWVPAENLQAEDRLCRIGQNRGVVITRLLADHPVDRRVAKVLESKRALLEKTGLL